MAKPNNKEWYSLKHLLGGCNLYLMYFLLGARCAGKSYALMEYCISYFKKTGNPFYWIRLSDTQAKNLLKADAMTLVDPDLRVKYDLHLETNGNHVYQVTMDGDKKIKKLFCIVMSANNFYNMKGNGFYDKNYLDNPKNKYLIVVDEFEKESGERETVSPVIALANALENIVRMEKDRVQIFFVGNNVEECSELLANMNFIPEEFKTYKLIKNKKTLLKYIKERNECRFAHKSMKEVDMKYAKYDFGKRVLVENLMPTEIYKAKRASTVAGILLGPNNSSLTNERVIDKTLITNKALGKPQYVIKFTKDKDHWYTWYSGCIIAPYKGEHKPVIAMRRYLDEVYNDEIQKNVISMFDTRSFLFRHTITFVKFQADLESVKPQV